MQIPEGADAGSIGELLEAKGVVADARFFELNATLTLRRGKLLTGNYVLRRNMTNGAAIDALMQGPKVRVVKTFDVDDPRGPVAPRGRRRRPRERDRGLLPEGVGRRPGDPARARKLGGCRRSRDTLEGFLFPATYDLKAGATADDLVDRQLDAFRDNFGSINLKAAKRKNLSPLRRGDHRLDDRARDAVGQGAAADRVGDLQPAQASTSRSASTRRSATTENNWSRAAQGVRARQRHAVQHAHTAAACRRRRSATPGLASLKAAAKPAKTDYMFYVAKPRRVPRVRRDATPSTSATSPPTRRAREANGGKAPEQKC